MGGRRQLLGQLPPLPPGSFAMCCAQNMHSEQSNRACHEVARRKRQPGLTAGRSLLASCRRCHQRPQPAFTPLALHDGGVAACYHVRVCVAHSVAHACRTCLGSIVMHHMPQGLQLLPWQRIGVGQLACAYCYWVAWAVDLRSGRRVPHASTEI
jgi:hypothetical protein